MVESAAVSERKGKFGAQMDGSMWSNEMEPTLQKRSRSYLYGTSARNTVSYGEKIPSTSRSTVAVPGDDIKGRVLLRAAPQSPHKLVDDLPSTLINLKRGHGMLKVTSVGKSVGTERSEFWQLVVSTVGLLRERK